MTVWQDSACTLTSYAGFLPYSMLLKLPSSLTLLACMFSFYHTKINLQSEYTRIQWLAGGRENERRVSTSMEMWDCNGNQLSFSFCFLTEEEVGKPQQVGSLQSIKIDCSCFCHQNHFNNTGNIIYNEWDEEEQDNEKNELKWAVVKAAPPSSHQLRSTLFVHFAQSFTTVKH